MVRKKFPEKKLSDVAYDLRKGVTRRHWRVFGNVLAHRNRVPAAQLSYSDNVGGFHPTFSRKWRFAGFWRGLGT